MNIINNFYKSDNRLLFFNIFYKNEKIYMIVPIYNKILDEKNLFLSIDNNILKIYEKIEKLTDWGERIITYIYEYKSNENFINIKVNYKNIEKNYHLEHFKTNNIYKLTLTTLFKYDYNLFSIFYDYYKDQGVEHFFMYYNGIITNEIRDIFNKSDITLIEWNYNYLNENCKNVHHAQIGQIYDSLYKFGKDYSEYMIFCDLDEYMRTPDKKIIDTIKNNPNIDVFGFCNIWSKTIDDQIPTTFPNKFLTSYSRDNYIYQSKNIYKISSIKNINIHFPQDFLIDNPLQKLDYKLFHFFNWGNKRRFYECNKLIDIDKIYLEEYIIIILRHVTNEINDTYWKESYNYIRKNYGNEIKIVIIDDNSTYTPTFHPLENCQIINSEYKGRGELLPYYYMYKLKLSNKAIIIHDSVFLNTILNIDDIEDYIYMWYFYSSPNDPRLPDQDDNENVERILSKFCNQDLIDYYRTKAWKGCFGGMSIITLNTLEKIVEMFPNFFEILIQYITNRRDRMAFERIISIILPISTNKVILNTVFGNIHQWCRDITDNKKHFFLNENDYKINKNYPVIKLWNNR